MIRPRKGEREWWSAEMQHLAVSAEVDDYARVGNASGLRAAIHKAHSDPGVHRLGNGPDYEDDGEELPLRMPSGKLIPARHHDRERMPSDRPVYHPNTTDEEPTRT